MSEPTFRRVTSDPDEYECAAGHRQRGRFSIGWMEEEGPTVSSGPLCRQCYCEWMAENFGTRLVQPSGNPGELP